MSGLLLNSELSWKENWKGGGYSLVKRRVYYIPCLQDRLKKRFGKTGLETGFA